MTREQLIASLTATDNRGYQINNECYFDWATQLEASVLMEISDGVHTVQLEMTREQMQSLQQRLTGWLLADAVEAS